MVRAHVLLHTQILRESLLTNRDFFSLSPEDRADLIVMRDAYEELFRSALEAGCRDGSIRVPYVPYGPDSAPVVRNDRGTQAGQAWLSVCCC
jgi:hypothetical protein